MGGWAELLDRIDGCRLCGLCGERQNTVPGEGDPNARLMLIGEGPGAEEDRSGRPFVGASGQLLEVMLREIGLNRRQVYICNVVKCRPPNNRTPQEQEAMACLPYLDTQIDLVKPEFLLLLGGTAGRYLLGPDARIRRDHGQWFEYRGIKAMLTYHPSAMLRDERQKIEAWRDFLALKERLNNF